MGRVRRLLLSESHVSHPQKVRLYECFDLGKCTAEEVALLGFWLDVLRYFEPDMWVSRATWYRRQARLRFLGVIE